MMFEYAHVIMNTLEKASDLLYERFDAFSIYLLN